jgi:hypothetical protein
MVDKKEIQEYLEGIRHIDGTTTWNFYTGGAYTKDGSLELYASYQGQVLDGNVYNKLYDQHIALDNTIKNYLRGEFGIDVAVDMIYGEIKELD